MRMAFLHPGPPADAQVYKNLKWVKEFKAGLNRPYSVKTWWGRAKKHTDYVGCKTEAEADAFIERQKASADGSEKLKEERKQQKIAGKAKYRELLQVGTLLHNSWGYEQTNCDFYQIVERKGDKVVLREISGAVVPDSGASHGMSCQMRAVPDSFVEGKEPITKMITGNGVQFDYGWTEITTPEAKHYCSWYA